MDSELLYFKTDKATKGVVCTTTKGATIEFQHNEDGIFIYAKWGNVERQMALSTEASEILLGMLLAARPKDKPVMKIELFPVEQYNNYKNYE